jgi:hypothetical protein
VGEQEQRISDMREMHYWIEEPDYSKGPAGDLVRVCYEDGSLWPCDAGLLLDQLAAAHAARAADQQTIRELMPLLTEWLVSQDEAMRIIGEPFVTTEEWKSRGTEAIQRSTRAVYALRDHARALLAPPAAEHRVMCEPTESGWRADCSCGAKVTPNGGALATMMIARRWADAHLLAAMLPAADQPRQCSQCTNAALPDDDWCQRCRDGVQRVQEQGEFRTDSVRNQPAAEGGAGDLADHPYMGCAPGGCTVPVPFISEDAGMCHWPYGNGPYTSGSFCSISESGHPEATSQQHGDAHVPSAS